MKMSKYLNKRIFVCLGLALIFLVAASFVASSEEGQQECDNITITFGQDPTGKVTRGTLINYNWAIRKEPPTCLAGEPYLLEIQGPTNEQRYSRDFQTPRESRNDFTANDSWKVPDDEPLGSHTTYLKIPNLVGSYIEFEVVDTLLVIQKLDDNAEGLPRWEFKLTDPDGNPETHFTDSNGEIRIEVPPKYAGREYTIEEIPQPGWSALSPIKQTVKASKGKTTPVLFRNTKADTKLIIRKFEDINRNSRIDGNDERLQGWEFKVTDPGGNTKQYTITNKKEIIIIVPPEYAEKKYTVEEILQPGWKSILPSKQPVKVPVPEGKTTTVQFLNSPTLLIIQKFCDSNRNNKIEGNDARLRDWKFKVTDPSAKPTYLVTNSKGEIIIEVPGEYAGRDYIIEETLPPKWESILPIEQPVHVNVPLGEAKTVRFLNRENDTRLIIQKFYDSNQNGEVDSEDERLRGWNFSVTDPVGKTTTKSTDNKGEIIIVVPEKYAGQKYTVEEKLQPDWGSVLPIEQPVHVKVPMGETKTIQFLNNKSITILRIQKFDDSNRNGAVDSEDKRLRGWNFSVTDPAGKTTTNITNNGGEIIIEVPPKYIGKEYTIEETLQPGWRALSRIKQTVKASKGETLPVRFLNQRIPPPTPTPSLPPTPTPLPGHLKIQKFYDPNVNKVQDPGEQGLPNWNFTIAFPDRSSKRITTNANGLYRLRNIPVGRYEITEEPGSCRWTSSTGTTQEVDVPAGKEVVTSFGNYIAECCMLPGCVWNNKDKNIEVCKSVNPCNVTLGKEAEVTVHLGLCVDREHILNGTKVRNISVIDTLHNYYSVDTGSFSESEKPNAIRRNPDGTTTIIWNISSLCCDEWRVSFNVTVAFALPIDVTESYGVSKVIYDDPETKVVRKLPIPAGKLLFVLPTPTPTPTLTPSPTPKPSGFEALLAIAGLLAVAYMMWRRKR